jgi:hypothetical protein
MAFKMKGSPMQRNYGIGTPTKKTGDPKKTELTQEEKDAAIAAAMPAATKEVLSPETIATGKSLGVWSGGSFDIDAAKAGIRQRQSVSGGSESNVAKRDAEIQQLRNLIKKLG